MTTKSNIQIAIEQENIKNRFKHTLSNLVESYTVKGNVFAIDYRKIPVEVSNGYFVEEKEFDNLNDLIKEMQLTQAVSINENKFILGHIEQQLSNCDENAKVLDIEYLKYVR